MNKIKKLYTDTSKAGSFAGLTTFKKNNQKFKIKDIKFYMSLLVIFVSSVAWKKKENYM